MENGGGGRAAYALVIVAQAGDGGVDNSRSLGGDEAAG